MVKLELEIYDKGLTEINNLYICSGYIYIKYDKGWVYKIMLKIELKEIC